jgi:hypothetical protein
MRFLLPAAALAAVLMTAVCTAAAKGPEHRQPRRGESHVSLHLSGHSVLGGNGVAVHGRVRPPGRQRLRVLVSGPDSRAVGVSTRADGSFALRWSPSRVGNYAVRAFRAHDRRSRAALSPARRLTSYRQAGASYYGPGLYGNGVACGGTLLPGTLGVANKTLPCGTRVKLRYHGRSVTVPVIDRGPYVAGRDYDLTEATKLRLGFPGVGTVLANR